MIPPSGTFLYRLVLRGTEAPWRLVASLEYPIVRTGDNLFDARLVGYSPAVDIWGDRITLIARQQKLAGLAAAFMTIDPDITRHFQGGDVLRLVRTGTASLGASVVRHGRLVLAVGAASKLPLGGNVHVVSVTDEADAPTPLFTQELPINSIFNSAAREEADAAIDSFIGSELRIRLVVSGQGYHLGSGDISQVGPYHVLVEHGPIPGIPGTDECLALSVEDAFPIEAAVRWARLLDDHDDSLTMVAWGNEGE